ncbi:hypothetical protein ABIC03_003551 [Bradyrhizobium sp. RT6a]|uniref:hypothetical protein n=1 Tax=Bradyrhizobium sp. RT6a TaxID=3156381 RepID=UPI0033957192
MINEVFNAMVERVVMIVSRIQGTYEFEVQPLREYFAARYLYNTASYSPPGRERKGTKPDRFDAIARNFYWLNVVRFFCGCFSKGELLDLADRVKELMSDALLGKTRHPVNLAAMLLSDWVFAQSPKAVNQLADPLCSLDALRRLSPRLQYASGETVTLPERSGGSLLFTKGFEILEQVEMQGDQLSSIARVVADQAPSEKVVARWLASPLQQDKLSKWLSIGVHTDALRNADKRSILERMGGAYSKRIVALLVQADRFDCIVQSEQHSELLKEVYLSEPDLHSPRLGQWPLYSVPLLLETQPSFDLPLNRVGLSKITSNLKSFEESVAGQPTFVQQCYGLSMRLGALADEPSPQRMRRLYDELFDHMYSLWGSKPAVVRAIWLHVSSRKVTASDAEFDFNKEVSAVKCLRAGKARRSRSSWWAAQFETTSAQSRKLLLLSHFRDATYDSIQHCAKKSADLLDELTETEWLEFRALFDSVCDQRSFNDRLDADKLKAIFQSQRALCLVAIRNPHFASWYYAHFCLDSGAVCGDRLRQLWTVQALQANTLDWKKGLSVIEETYARGVWAETYALYRFGHYVNVPGNIANEILSTPLRYPHALWESAERVATISSRKAVKPVGGVAKADRWFS